MEVHLVKLPVRNFEDEDCAVDSCAVLTGLPYPVVHSRFKKHGRKDGEATEWSVLTAVYKELGFPLGDPVRFDPPVTVNRLIKRNLLPEGRFLVYITGHVFPLVDGHTDDWSATSKYRVNEAYPIK